MFTNTGGLKISSLLDVSAFAWALLAFSSSGTSAASFSCAWNLPYVSKNEWSTSISDHAQICQVYLTFLCLLLIMLLDRFKELMGLFSNKKTRLVSLYNTQFTLLNMTLSNVHWYYQRNYDYFTFMFALSPSSLARLRKSAYFMESKSIFDACWSDFIEVSGHSRSSTVWQSRPTVEILLIQNRAAGVFWLADAGHRSQSQQRWVWTDPPMWYLFL